MISLIYARTAEGVIGVNNSLPWYLPEDLKRFKEKTVNKTIIMGKNTLISFPNGKPLPNRKHICLSKTPIQSYVEQGVEFTNDIQSLIDKYLTSEEEVFVVGGKSVYEQFLPYAKRVYQTLILNNIEGDTVLGEEFYLKSNEWKVVDITDIRLFENLEYVFETLERR